MPQIPFYKRLMSYLYPLRLESTSSTENPLLELFLYRGQYQLATQDALYSDGRRYRPMLVAFEALKQKLKDVKNVLVLGTGLGSAVHILAAKGYHPSYTLVEHDDLILEWCIEHLPGDEVKRVWPVCADAQSHMAHNDMKYDLVIADIFKSRVVPAFVTTEAFLTQCRRSVNPGGYIVINYMVNNDKEWRAAIAAINAVFPGNRVINHGVNRIVIATV